MRQLVHDTDYDPAELDAAGWPLRWHASPGDANGWKVEKTIDGNNVRQTLQRRRDGRRPRRGCATSISCRRYDVWQQVADAEAAGSQATVRQCGSQPSGGG